MVHSHCDVMRCHVRCCDVLLVVCCVFPAILHELPRRTKTMSSSSLLSGQSSSCGLPGPARELPDGDMLQGAAPKPPK